MKIFTLGKGFVSAHLPYKNLLQDFRITNNNLSLVASMIDLYQPDVIVNCIGKTGSPNVDWCESNKEITASTNTALPIMLAELCAARSIHLIHIGSGCIFYGKSPNLFWGGSNAAGGAEIMHPNLMQPYEPVDLGWRETDFANPKSFYSKTKYAADLVIGDMKNVSILRIRMPISTKNSPRNLLNKISKYDQLIDIPNSVTFMDDLVRCVEWTAKESKTGIYHVTNPEPLSAAQVMREYQSYEPTHNFKVISEEELDKLTIAKRSNCILSTHKLSVAGFSMTPSKEALKNCMRQYIKNVWSSNVE